MIRPDKAIRRRSRRFAFTLVELLVVITIIVVLLALLAPALDKAVEQTQRTICAANQRGIQLASTQYAMANRKVFVICRARGVQIAFNPLGNNAAGNRPEDNNVDWLAALATAGLAETGRTAVTGSSVSGQPSAGSTGRSEHLPTRVWDCPSRGFKSKWDPIYNQVIISYQYFGGIETWINPWVGAMPSRSPVTLSRSEPDWALTADTTWQIGQVWGNDAGWPEAYGNLPSHKLGDGLRPAGHNQSYVNGSADWVDFERMIYIHNWGGGVDFETYWYQRDLGDWTPPGPALAANSN